MYKKWTLDLETNRAFTTPGRNCPVLGSQDKTETGMGVTEHRHRLPREVTGFPILEIPRSHLDTVLSNWLWVALLEQGG